MLRPLLTLDRTTLAFYDSKRADFQKIYTPSLTHRKNRSKAAPSITTWR
ncbi:hypothetical protein [Bradyrhizobium sp. LMTR 3]|nr:hypothetical protein [Bradyrhizobium sp. LMTR 3]